MRTNEIPVPIDWFIANLTERGIPETRHDLNTFMSLQHDANGMRYLHCPADEQSSNDYSLGPTAGSS